MKSSSKGFTLVEVLISMAIFSIFMAGVTVLTMSTYRFWQLYQASAQAQQEVRKALNMIASDLHVAQNIAITANPTRISFTRFGIGAVNYTWTSTGGQANQLVRTVGAQTSIVARNISNLSFTAVSAINVDIQISSTVQLPPNYIGSLSLVKKVTVR